MSDASQRAPWAIAAERPEDLAAALADGRIRRGAQGWNAQLADGTDVAFTRLYVAEEFCAQLILKPAEMRAFATLAAEAGVPMTLATPPVTDAELAELRPLLAILAETPDPEVVCNDWGTLRLVSREFPGVGRVLGRVLRRQLKDPRAEGRESTATMPAAYADLLVRLGVGLISADRLPDGPSALPLALHVPYEFVTSGRMCAVSGIPFPEPKKFLSDFSCPKPCRDFSLRLHDPSVAQPMWQKGNTLYAENGGVATIAGGLGRVARFVYDLSTDRGGILLAQRAEVTS